MISYGIALLIMTIVLYTIFQLGVFNPRLAPIYCSTAPSFICPAYTINTTGAVTVILAQATGGTMIIKGAACSSLANQTIIGPAYGNINVVPYTPAPQFYPNNALKNYLTVYSSNSVSVSVWCYTNLGIATGSLGSTFSGFVWLNYTLSNLPQSVNTIQQVVALTAKYS